MYSSLSITLLYLGFAHSGVLDCYYSNISKPYGYIQGPHLKNIYSREYCFWILKLGYYNILEIRIEYVNLNTGDYIYIYDGATINSPILIKLYGTSRFRKITTSTGNAFIHYQKQSIGRYSTFNITYQIKGVCIPGIQESCSEQELNCYDIRYEKCNSIWNCPISGKDEENCYTCQAQQKSSDQKLYPCSQLPNSPCYSRSQRCNAIKNCDSLADEMHCDPVQCGAHNKTFLCQTFPTLCISEFLRCDGSISCRDGSDEHNCDVIDPYYNSPHIRIILVSSVSVILCLLMVVLGLVCICRLHKMRILTTRNLARRRGFISQYDSSIQQLINEQMRRGPLPPDYNYALCHSRPFRSVVDVQKIIGSRVKSSGSKNKRLPNSCQYSDNPSQPVSHCNNNNNSNNAYSNSAFESDVHLLVPDAVTAADTSCFNNNNQLSDAELIDPGFIEGGGDLPDSSRFAKLNSID